MATIPKEVVNNPNTTDFNGISIIRWANLTAGDVGEAITLPKFSDRSVQVEGTFGSCSIEGSLDGVNFHPLNDPDGNGLVFIIAKIEAILEMSVYLRPVVTGVGANLTITFVGRSR
jgi:hypothetical protein